MAAAAAAAAGLPVTSLPSRVTALIGPRPQIAWGASRAVPPTMRTSAACSSVRARRLKPAFSRGLLLRARHRFLSFPKAAGIGGGVVGPRAVRLHSRHRRTPTRGLELQVASTKAVCRLLPTPLPLLPPGIPPNPRLGRKGETKLGTEKRKKKERCAVTGETYRGRGSKVVRVGPPHRRAVLT